MIKDNGLSFKDLEKKIYEWECQICREFTKEFLERYDKQLMERREKAKYRNKAVREKLHDERDRKAVLELLEGEKIDEMFQYLEIKIES